MCRLRRGEIHSSVSNERGSTTQTCRGKALDGIHDILVGIPTKLCRRFILSSAPRRRRASHSAGPCTQPAGRVLSHAASMSSIPLHNSINQTIHSHNLDKEAKAAREWFARFADTYELRDGPPPVGVLAPSSSAEALINFKEYEEQITALCYGVPLTTSLSDLRKERKDFDSEQRKRRDFNSPKTLVSSASSPSIPVRRVARQQPPLTPSQFSPESVGGARRNWGVDRKSYRTLELGPAHVRARLNLASAFEEAFAKHPPSSQQQTWGQQWPNMGPNARPMRLGAHASALTSHRFA